jgi:SAM-dependent methyltransferase
MMTTHQAIGGMTDEELLQRMVNSHAERFGDSFWEFFDAHVWAHLPPNPVVVDLGCGPGLFLRDLAARYPGVTLHGYDVTPAMIDHACGVEYASGRPTLEVHDLNAKPLPLPDGSVHLVCMFAVLHVLPEPLPALAEIKRVLAPNGIVLLHDWIRASLERYLTMRLEGVDEADLEASRKRWFRLFPVHNKYTEDDWRWLLAEAGFTVSISAQVRQQFRLFVVRPA